MNETKDVGAEGQQLRRLWGNPTLNKLVTGGYLEVPSRTVSQGLPTADERFAYQQIGIRNVAGTSAGKLYVCLPSAANPPVWSWVQVATG